MTDFPRDSEEEGARKLVDRAAIVGCILVVAAWFAFPWFLGSKDHLVKSSTASAVHTPATVGNAVPARSEATSGVAKQNPADDEHATIGRVSATKETSEPINITDAQRATLRSIFASGNPPRVERPNFEVMIGASVAEQTPLADLPPEAPKVLNGFSGDQFVIAGDELVIVNQRSRRVAAIIGGVK